MVDRLAFYRRMTGTGYGAQGTGRLSFASKRKTEEDSTRKMEFNYCRSIEDSVSMIKGNRINDKSELVITVIYEL